MNTNFRDDICNFVSQRPFFLQILGCISFGQYEKKTVLDFQSSTSRFIFSKLTKIWENRFLGAHTTPTPHPKKYFDIHEILMRPRIFIFCSYLHKKFCGDVLAPSEHFSDPLPPSAGPNRGPKIQTIYAKIQQGYKDVFALLWNKAQHTYIIYTNSQLRLTKHQHNVI